MNPELLKEAQGLWRTREAIGKFGQRFQVFPPQAAAQVVRGFEKLSQDISRVEQPANKEELYQLELQRRLEAEAVYLDHFLSGERFTYQDVIRTLGIEQIDLDGLGEWLDTHREETIVAVERKFETTVVESYEEPVDLKDPDKAREAEGVARSEIGKYHIHLGKLIGGLTRVGEYLRDIRAVPTEQERSEFKFLTKKLMIAIPAICYVIEDDSIRINHRELIRLFGHEGMGHALHKVITDAREDLPFFLKESSQGTIAAEESVTQFFAQVIFDDLNNSPQTQRQLGIEHRWEEIYQEEVDTRLINEYQRNLFAYAITVLADLNLGDPKDPATIQKKIDLIRQKAINPLFASGFVEHHSNASLDSCGNLVYNLAHELRYSAKPVARSLETFKEHGIEYGGDNRSKIDFVFLTGYWTSRGFRENAELSARE